MQESWNCQSDSILTFFYLCSTLVILHNSSEGLSCVMSLEVWSSLTVAPWLHGTITQWHRGSQVQPQGKQGVGSCYFLPSNIGVLTYNTQKMAYYKYHDKFSLLVLVILKTQHVDQFLDIYFSLLFTNSWLRLWSPAPLWPRALLVVVVTRVRPLHPLLDHLRWHLISLKTRDQ